jgi:hypothetical protein
MSSDEIWVAPTTDALVGRLGDPRTWVVVDVSAGGSAGQSATAQLTRQLGMESETAPTPADAGWLMVGHEWEYADFIARSVDREGRGDTVLIDASTAASRIAGELRRNVVTTCAVITPGPREPLSRYDRVFLAELGGRLAGYGRMLTITWPATAMPGASAIHEAGAVVPMVALVPGLLDAELAAALADESEIAQLIPIRGGLFMVPPQLRQAAAAAGPLDYDRLAARQPDRAELAAFAQRRGNAYFAQPALLCQQGWAEFADHHTEAGVDLLAHAARCARSPLEKAICAAQLGGMAIALRQFDLPAQLPAPSASAPAELRGFLRQCKGWGLVMSGEPSRALAELRLAIKELAGWAGRREYLYLLNITALAALRSGEADEALALEQHIAAALARASSPDRQLRYVNELNLARLYRRRQQPDLARAHYDAGFATTRGVGTQGDILHDEVCHAHLDTRQERDADAAAAWLRAALLWSGFGCPRALGERVAMAILGTGGLGDPVDPAAISEALLARLQASDASESAGQFRGRREQTDVPDIAWLDADQFADEAVDVDEAVLIAAAGWALIVRPATHRPLRAVPAGMAGDDGRQLLRRAIVNRLQALQPLPHWDSAGVLLIDDRLRRGIPRRPAEAVESALRLRVRRLVVEGREYHLGEALAREAELQLGVRVGAAVTAISAADGIDPDGLGQGRVGVRFGRYRPPLELSQWAAAALEGMRSGEVRTVQDVVRRTPGIDEFETVRLLRRLESDRVIELTVDDETSGRLLDGAASNLAATKGAANERRR